ncbi:MAG: hypothetical protein IJE29_04630 [Firmicutes bacterium]|nr:hypothetical protein [Bacillota bacterium]
MDFMDKLKNSAKNIGDMAQDLAKTAGDKAQDLARAAQEKTAYIKELSALKAEIREQAGMIAQNKGQIAEQVLALLEDGQTEFSDEIKQLANAVTLAKAKISELEAKIEDLKAAASAKNPELAQELSKAIAEIDREQAVDIKAAETAEEKADEENAAEYTTLKTE